MLNQWMLTPFFLDAPDPALRQLAQPDWWVNDGGASGTAPPPSAAAIAASSAADAQMTRMSEIHRPLTARVAAAAAEGERPVSIAGDCCAVIAVIAGLQKAGLDPVLLWLDAHGDFNTHDTTLSGFVGGMPLAMITGRGHRALIDAAALRPLPDEDVLLADARDLDEPERELLERSAVTRYAEFQTLLDRLPDRPIHVHFDVDVLDPIEAPAMLYPVANGVPAATLAPLLERLRTTRRLVSASMTPWAIARDKDGRTAEACWRVFHALVGPAAS